MDQRRTNKTHTNLNALRVIGGRWRGRKIGFENEPDLRPTPNRVRETLFNWLQTRVIDSRCLDLFCGSGALGIEALSRGADHCDFVDINPVNTANVQIIIDNLSITNANVVQSNAIDFLNRQQNKIPYDIVFLDPPFKVDIISQSLLILSEKQLVHPRSYIYIESENPIDHIQLPATWQIYKHKKAGNVHYHLVLTDTT